MTVYKAFFDRSISNNNGLFTLQDEKGNKIFERLPARSGQADYSRTSWIRGKSPIPYSYELKYQMKLWLSSINIGMDSKKNGIGEFFPISNTLSERLIEGCYVAQDRMDIGLHWENDKPGSAGCIVLLNDTPGRRDQVVKLFKFLHTIKEPYIQLVVL